MKRLLPLSIGILGIIVLIIGERIVCKLNCLGGSCRGHDPACLGITISISLVLCIVGGFMYWKG